MAKNWAITIGVNQYDYLQPLNYAKRDAHLMHDFLRNEASFEKVFFFSDDSPNLAGKSTRPNRANLRRVLRELFEKPFMSAGDNFWFFFSGHGMRHADRDYLMPSDGDSEDIEETAIPIHFVSERLRRCGADNVVLILDACRNQGTRGEGVGRQTAEQARQTGVISIFSCSPNEYSYELEELQQGAFTSALLEGLGIQGKCATVERLNQYLSLRVPELALQHNKARQTPYIIAEPVSKSHLILIPKYAEIEDIDLLKKYALKAEVEQNFDLAKQLWIRILAAASGQDIEAIEALPRIQISRIRKENSVNLHVEKLALKSQRHNDMLASQKDTQIINLVPNIHHGFESIEDEQDIILPVSSIQGIQVFEFKFVKVDYLGKEIKCSQRRNYYLSEELGDEVDLEMVYIPGGDFLMGSPKSEGKRYFNERPQHQVIVKPFLMSKYPITKSQWREVAYLPEMRQKIKSRTSLKGSKNHPVTQVSWFDAMEFCDRLSQKTGKKYTLATEAQWEYACRAGTTTPFHFGQTITSSLVNCDCRSPFASEPKGIYLEETTPVDNFAAANPFGLFDMHGNVWEWCLDHWHDNYLDAPNKEDVWLKNKDFPTRVMRGGSWLNDKSPCRSASRLWKDANETSKHVGFRVVCHI